MADNDLDLKVTLTAEEKGMDAFGRAQRALNDLNEKLRRFNNIMKADPTIGKIVTDKDLQRLDKAGVKVRYVTDRSLRAAKELKDQGQNLGAAFGAAMSEVDKLGKSFRAMRPASKNYVDTANAYAKAIQRAASIQYINNRDSERFARVRYALTQAQGRLESQLAANKARAARIEEQATARHARESQQAFNQHLRNQRFLLDLRERSARAEEDDRIRRRRAVTDPIRAAGGRFGRAARAGDTNFWNSPYFYALMAGGAAAAASRSSIKAASEISTAETNLDIFAGMNRNATAAMRAQWGNEASMRLGFKPAEMMQVLAETLKAGIPKDSANAFAELAMKAGAGLDLDVNETIKVAARLATLTQDMGNFDVGAVGKILNSVAIAAMETAADASEIISTIRRGAGAISGSKMTVDELSAFAGAGISSGIQQGRTGTLMGFLTGELVNAGRARGQRANDIQAALRNLRMGDRRSFSRKFAENPTEMLVDIFDRMKNMTTQKRGETARLLGMREWDTELLQMVTVVDDIKRTLAQIRDPANSDKLNEAAAKRLESLQGVWKRTAAAWSLVWSEIGFGFEGILRDVSDWFINLVRKGDLTRLRTYVDQALRGLLKGFGFDSIKDMLDEIFPSGQKDSWLQNIFDFFKGFAEGVKMVVAPLAQTLKSMGIDTWGELGKLAGAIVALTFATHLARPAITILGMFKDVLLGFVALALGVKAITGIGGLAIGAAGGAGVGAAAGGALAGLGAAIGASLVAFLAGATIIVGTITVGYLIWRYWDNIKDALFKHRSREEIEKEQNAVQERLRKQSEQNKQDWKNLFDTVKGWFGISKTNAAPGVDPDLPAVGAIQNSFTPAINILDQIEENTSVLKRGTAETKMRTQLASLGAAGAIGMGSSYAGGFAGNRPGGGGGGGGPGGTPGAGSPGNNFGMGGSRSWRNNNPGNLKYGEFARAQGATGQDERGFARFPDYATGRKAMENLLFGPRYAGAGLSVSGAISKWAPSSDGNNTAAYAANVARAIGVDPNTPLSQLTPEQRAKMLDAMQKHEGWQPGAVGRNTAGQLTGAPVGGANLMRGQYGAPGTNLTTITTASGKKVTVHSAAAPYFKGFLDDLEAQGYQINSLGGYNMRNKAGGGGISQHAYGNAIDINPYANPFGRRLVTDMPPNIRDLARKWNLRWGGDWNSVKDAMHFEWNGQTALPQLNAAAVANKTVQSQLPMFAQGNNGLGVGGVGGPVQITIQGASDPHAVANLVQQRFEEQMSWRTHDAEEP